MKIEELNKFEGDIVKVYFKEHDQRYPMIGKIVHLHDAKELANKKMVRFIREDRLDTWDGFSIIPSKIFVVSDFRIIECDGMKHL